MAPDVGPALKKDGSAVSRRKTDLLRCLENSNASAFVNYFTVYNFRKL